MPPRKTTEGDEAPKKRAPRTTKKYVRNITRSQVAFRIGDREGRRIELKPRGQRGDLAALNKDELDQLEDIGYMYEVITETEAKDILSKQMTNQQAFHPALAALLNSKGEPLGEDPVVVDHNANGYVVAQIQGPTETEQHGKRVTVESVLADSVVKGPQQVAVPGSALDAAQRADAIARNKSLEGPAAGGIANIVMEPVKHNA
jgi:hypothetical protein